MSIFPKAPGSSECFCQTSLKVLVALQRLGSPLLCRNLSSECQLRKNVLRKHSTMKSEENCRRAGKALKANIEAFRSAHSHESLMTVVISLSIVFTCLSAVIAIERDWWWAFFSLLICKKKEGKRRQKELMAFVLRFFCGAKSLTRDN